MLDKKNRPAIEALVEFKSVAEHYGAMSEQGTEMRHEETYIDAARNLMAYLDNDDLGDNWTDTEIRDLLGLPEKV